MTLRLSDQAVEALRAMSAGEGVKYAAAHPNLLDTFDVVRTGEDSYYVGAKGDAEGEDVSEQAAKLLVGFVASLADFGKAIELVRAFSNKGGQP